MTIATVIENGEFTVLEVSQPNYAGKLFDELRKYFIELERIKKEKEKNVIATGHIKFQR